MRTSNSDIRKLGKYRIATIWAGKVKETHSYKSIETIYMLGIISIGEYLSYLGIHNANMKKLNLPHPVKTTIKFA